MLNRIYVSDVDGRAEGTITTESGVTVMNIERKSSGFNEIPQEALDARSSFKCILMPLSPSTLTASTMAAIRGEIKFDHPDMIESGIICNEITGTHVRVQFPYDGMDNIYNLCYRLCAVVLYTDLYTGTMEPVVLLMPAGAYAAFLGGFNEFAGIWKDTYFHSGVDMASPVAVDADDVSVHVLKELGIDLFIRYGYLDANIDTVTVTTNPATVKLAPELCGTIADKTIPDIHAWINAVGCLKADIEGGKTTPSEETLKWLNYRADEVVFPEPTEEEVHPQQPEIAEETEGTEVTE